MAKKTSPPLKVRTVLLIPVQQARERVFRQLDKGHELLKMEIRNEEEYRQVKAKYRSWDDYTEELLKQIFNTDDVSRSFVGIFPGLLGGGEAPLHKEIQFLRDDIQRHLERLASIYEKLELFPVDSMGIVPGAQLSVSPDDSSPSASVTIHNYGTIYNPQIQQGSSDSSQQITVGNDEIAQAFAAILQKVNSLPEGSDKSDAQQAVRAIEAEARKGTEAQEKTARKWLNFLIETAPDAGQVALDTLVHPIKGLSTVVQKVAERAKAEREAKK